MSTSIKKKERASSSRAFPSFSTSESASFSFRER